MESAVIKLTTRAIIDAIHYGTLSTVRTVPDPVFGFNVVPECPGARRDPLAS